MTSICNNDKKLLTLYIVLYAFEITHLLIICLCFYINDLLNTRGYNNDKKLFVLHIISHEATEYVPRESGDGTPHRASA